MKYRYLYQTKENENREGEIRAANRAEAYAALRKQGIRPYRVIGDDPWRWRPLALGVLLPLAAIALTAAVFVWRASSDRVAPIPRAQLVGDRSLIFDGVRSCWKDVLASPLDRYLSAYAQPGAAACPPLLTTDELSAFPAELEKGMARSSDESPEVRQLKNILAGMREEMRTALANGSTVGDYLVWLETRQTEELDFRERAAARVRNAPTALRYQTWKGVNERLRARGMEQLEAPPDMRLEDF